MSSTSESRGTDAPNDRQEAQTAIARLLLDKIQADTYPSSTHMDMLEQMMPRTLRSEYFEVLLEKVGADQWPSISMLRRMSRLAETL